MSKPEFDTESRIRLAIVDDEQVVLEGMACLFGRQRQFEVVAVGRTWEELRAASTSPPQVVLADVGRLHQREWDELINGCLREMSAKLVALDDCVRDGGIRHVLKRGVHGYATKSDSFSDIRGVVLKAARNEQCFSSLAQTRLRQTHFGWQVVDGGSAPGLHLLTARETEILAHIAEGHTSVSCAKLLQLSPSTVDNHKAKIMKKLQVRRLTELVRFAIGQGLVPAILGLHPSRS